MNPVRSKSPKATAPDLGRGTSNGVKRPLVWISLPFICGILIARFIKVPFPLLYFGIGLFLIFAFFSWRKKLISFLFLLLSILLIGSALYQISYLTGPNHIINFPEANESFLLEGAVVKDPSISVTSWGTKKASLILNATAVSFDSKRYEVTGLVKVTIYNPGQRFNYGDELALFGKLTRPRGPSNPGQFDWSRYLARQRIYMLLTVKDGRDVILLKQNKGNPIVRWSLKVKHRAKSIITKTLPKPQSDILSAVLLGDRQDLSWSIRDLFIQTGTIHILAISGLHVGLVALILMTIFRILRIPRKVAYLGTITILISYAIITGARVPVTRATIMAVAILFGMLIGRDWDVYNSLALAAIIILVRSPAYLFEAGFQLSFITVGSICYFTPKIEDRLSLKRLAKKGSKFSKTGYFLGSFVCVSFAAWIGIIPIVLYYFNIFSPITILANLIVIPLLFVIIALGIAILIFSSISIVLGQIFASAEWIILYGLVKVVSTLAKVPFGFMRSATPTIPLIIGYYGLLFVVFNHQRLRISGRSLGIVLLSVLNIVCWTKALAPVPKELRVTFLDVGQGDSIYLEFPGGSNMLIDGGSGGDNDQGRWVISPYLWSKGVRRLDSVLLTHPHSDHLGGLITVLKNFSVGWLFDNGIKIHTHLYKSYEEVIESQRINHATLIGSKMIIGYDGARVHILHPSAESLKDPSLDLNDSSIVVKVTYGKVDFLLTGDILIGATRELWASGHNLEAEVIKMPHHGEDLAREAELLLRSSRPEIAIISVRAPNRYGLPSPKTVELLNRLNIRTFRTDKDGAIQITTDGEKIGVRPFLHIIHPQGLTP